MMALKGLYREVWEDEELRKNKVTQSTVILVIDAFGRVIKKSLKEKGFFRWKNHFSFHAVKIKGWNTKSVRTGKDEKIKDFKRIYVRPSKDLKEEVNKQDN